MALDKRKLILASGSPRRRELLAYLGLKFDVHASDVEEVTDKTNPKAVVEDLAKLKGDDIFNKRKDDEVSPLIISSDTIVVIDNKILGKPKDKGHAREMLLSLSGRSHKVFTSIYFKSINHQNEICSHIFSIETDVTFAQIDEELLEFYLSGDEPYDKAGAYGIQAQGLLFVESISGSYSNVVGFPLSFFYRELKSFVSSLGLSQASWKNVFES